MGKHRSGKPAFYWRPINEPQRQAMEAFREGADVLFLVGPVGGPEEESKAEARLAAAVGVSLSDLYGELPSLPELPEPRKRGRKPRTKEVEA